MNPTIGYIAAAIALLVWGCGIVFIKRVHSQPQYGIAVSMTSGMIALIAPLLFTNTDWPDWRTMLSPTGAFLVLAGIFQFPLATIAYYASIQRCEISLAAPLTRIKVTLLALTVIAFRLEPVGWKLIVSAFLGMAGAMMLSMSMRRTSASRRVFSGVILAMLASIFWVVGDVLTMRVLKVIPALPTTVLSLAAGLAVYTVWLILMGKLAEIRQIPAGDKIMYSLHGLFNFALGYGCFYLAIKHIGVTRAVIITASWPMLTFALGLFLYRETVTPAKLVGVFLIMASVFLAILK